MISAGIPTIPSNHPSSSRARSSRASCPSRLRLSTNGVLLVIASSGPFQPSLLIIRVPALPAPARPAGPVVFQYTFSTLSALSTYSAPDATRRHVVPTPSVRFEGLNILFPRCKARVVEHKPCHSSQASMNMTCSTGSSVGIGDGVLLGVFKTMGCPPLTTSTTSPTSATSTSTASTGVQVALCRASIVRCLHRRRPLVSSPAPVPVSEN